MSWDENIYPPAMSNLPTPVRMKAIEIANRLVDQGYEEAKAVPLALAEAREWADKHWEEEIDWDDVGIEPEDD